MGIMKTNDPELMRCFHAGRLSDRSVDELIGLSAGIIADGVVHQKEAEFLHSWLAKYASVVNENSMTRNLLIRIREMLSDGVLDDEESRELLEMLKSFAGVGEVGEVPLATDLPLDNPPPRMVADGKRFCFTGLFLFGKRDECEQHAKDSGGTAGSLTRKTDYLVIGHYAAESWKHASYGNKILRALEMREKGVPIYIVSEEHLD